MQRINTTNPFKHVFPASAVLAILLIACQFLCTRCEIIHHQPIRTKMVACKKLNLNYFELDKLVELNIFIFFDVRFFSLSLSHYLSLTLQNLNIVILLEFKAKINAELIRSASRCYSEQKAPILSYI